MRQPTPKLHRAARIAAIRLGALGAGALCAAAASGQGLDAYVAKATPCFNWKRCEQKPVETWGTLTHL